MDVIDAVFNRVTLHIGDKLRVELALLVCHLAEAHAEFFVVLPGLDVLEVELHLRGHVIELCLDVAVRHDELGDCVKLLVNLEKP